MELLLAAAVGGVVTQGVKYAWSYISTPSNMIGTTIPIHPDERIPEEKTKKIISQQEENKKNTNEEIRRTVAEIRGSQTSIPLDTSQFLLQIQQRRQSLRPVKIEKRLKAKTELQLRIESRRLAMSDSFMDESPTSPV